MAIGPADLQAISEAFEPLCGNTPWRVRLGEGSFVTMEFGELVHEEDNATAHGEWHLWIYSAAWRLESETEMIVGSEDSRDSLERALIGLEEVPLISVSVDPPSLGLELAFRGITMKVFPIVTRDAEHWILYTPSNRVLAAGPGSSWRWTE